MKTRESSCGIDPTQENQRIHPQIQYRFNPFEIAVIGPLNSDLIAFAERLVTQFSETRKVGIVANENLSKILIKWTRFRNQTTGIEACNSVFLDETHYIQSTPVPLNKYELPATLIDADVVFILGATPSLGTPKIVLADGTQSDSTKLLNEDLKNILAICGNEQSLPKISGTGIPYLFKDDVHGLSKIVEGHLTEKIKQLPLFGLVLAGGKSTRMKKDKALLEYHGKPQIEVCDDLLSKYCEKVYISNRQDQERAEGQEDFLQMHDVFKGFGPIGGILTALVTHPGTAWMVIACDLPFVDDETIEKLLEKRNPCKMATAYKSSHNGLPEPLCAVYEPKSIHRLLHFLGLGYKCPRKVLINSDVHLLDPVNDKALENVNTVNDYHEAIKKLGSKKVK